MHMMFGETIIVEVSGLYTHYFQTKFCSKVNQYVQVDLEDCGWGGILVGLGVQSRLVIGFLILLESFPDCGLLDCLVGCLF